jgi:hypothetical protein
MQCLPHHLLNLQLLASLMHRRKLERLLEML